MKTNCGHLDQIQEVTPSGAGCVECLAAGRHDLVHLRVCQLVGMLGLRFLAGLARHRPLPHRRPPGDALVRARRGRGTSAIRMTSSSRWRARRRPPLIPRASCRR